MYMGGIYRKGKAKPCCCVTFCGEPVKAGHCMCLDHWRMVDADLQKTIGFAYRARDMKELGAALTKARDKIETELGIYKGIFDTPATHAETGAEGGGTATPPSKKSRAATSKRKATKGKRKKKPTHPKSDRDWYVEESWTVQALIDAEAKLNFGRVSWHAWGTVWDPACGRGTIPEQFKANDFDAIGSDIAPRGYRPQLVNFLTAPVDVKKTGGQAGLSIVCNPPYSYQKGILEAFIRRALSLATNKVAMLVPIGRQSGELRHQLFTEFPPSRIYVFSERVSMPPGAMVEELGDKAYKRGRIDYMWLVWDRKTPSGVGFTRWSTIAPRAAEERLAA